MNRSKRIVFKQLIIALGFLVSTGVFCQEQSKTFNERFFVAEDAVLEINTSYADIEFETWDKNEVEINATITLEGATKEEVENYFKNSPIEILGNSKEITISSNPKNHKLFMSNGSRFTMNDFDIDIPEIASFVMEMPQIAPLPEMPPLPQTKAFSFDYEAYQKDGEKYMRKWQKNFEKSFDKDHQKRLEEWAIKMEAEASKMKKRLDAQEKNRLKQMEEREKQMEERAKQLEEHAAELEERQGKRLAEKHELKNWTHSVTDSLHTAPNIFYLSTDGEQKNYKIKKVIKIKLPKSTRIRMDVRHGEVKLAENTRDLNANLSHSSLWAATIDGLDTNVSASYSPVNVQKWNYGRLSTKYSDAISLAEVVQLQLQATSSNVTIMKLQKNAFIKNSFGALDILDVGSNFEELDVSLNNAELNLQLSNVGTDVYIKGTSSSLEAPSNLHLTKTENGTTTVRKGFYLKDGTDRSILITADYSEMVIR